MGASMDLDRNVASTVCRTLLGLVYYTYLEGTETGQTLGKKALGIRVIDLSAGGSIGFGRAFIRYIRPVRVRDRPPPRLPLDALGQGEAEDLARQVCELGRRAGVRLPRLRVGG